MPQPFVAIQSGTLRQIDINADQEIRYWTGQFAVSEVDLRKAIADVGVTASDVADHLGKAPAEGFR